MELTSLSLDVIFVECSVHWFCSILQDQAAVQAPPQRVMAPEVNEIKQAFRLLVFSSDSQIPKSNDQIKYLDALQAG